MKNSRSILPLVTMLVLFAGIYLLASRNHSQALSDEPLVLKTQPPQIVMFSTQSCQYCRLAKQFFDKHQLPYTEHDIETSDEQRRMFDLLGGRGTPLLIINKQLIQGFDEDEVRKAL